MKQVDIGTLGFMGEIGGDKDGQTFGVGWTGSVIGGQSRQSSLFLDHFGIGVHDFRCLAVQAEADEISDVRLLICDLLQASHDELEMGQIIIFILADHQKTSLIRGSSMQSVAAVKHENLERGDAEFRDQLT